MGAGGLEISTVRRGKDNGLWEEAHKKIVAMHSSEVETRIVQTRRTKEIMSKDRWKNDADEVWRRRTLTPYFRCIDNQP